MKLRPYQRASLEAVKTKLWAGTNRQLIKLPTGMGKTVVFANMPDYLGFKNRMMVVVHREELVHQAATKLKAWNPGRSVGIEMADFRSNNEDLIVASVQTIGKKNSPRLAQFDPQDFDAIIVDEAHHATGDTYGNILNHFQLVDTPTRLCTGVTATPNRADGKGLGDIFQEIVYDMSLLEGINQGWLSDLRGIKVSTKNSLDAVKTLGGDFNLGDLTSAINTEARNDLIVRAWLEHGQDRQTVAFTVDIKHTKDLADAFKRYGIVCEGVWGTDPDRAEKLRGHREGQIKVLTNCQILTEGYDDWRIGCVILARPTKSETLYTQIVGRGTRIPDGIDNLLEARKLGVRIDKEDCILLDVVDMTSRHSLISLPSLFGLNTGLDLKGKKISKVLEEFAEIAKKKPYVDTSQVNDISKLSSFAEQVDLFRITYAPEIIQFSEFQWHKVGQDAYLLTLPNNDSVRITKDLLDHWRVLGSVLTTKIDETCKSFSEAIQTADRLVRKFAGDGIMTLIKRDAKWHKGDITPGQREICRKLRISVPAGATKGDVAKKISSVLAQLKDSRMRRMAS